MEIIKASELLKELTEISQKTLINEDKYLHNSISQIFNVDVKEIEKVKSCYNLNELLAIKVINAINMAEESIRISCFSTLLIFLSKHNMIENDIEDNVEEIIGSEHFRALYNSAVEDTVHNYNSDK